MKSNIRQMLPSDLKHVAKLYINANLFAKYKDIYNWTKEGLDEFPELNLVYIKNNKIIGAISAILESNKVAIVNDIAVLEKYRCQNIGAVLLKNIIKIIKQQKIKKIKLWTHWTCAAAIPFYYKLGFRIKKFSQTKNIKGVPNGEDIIRLEKII